MTPTARAKSNNLSFPPTLTLETLADVLGNPEWLPVDCRFDLENPNWGQAAFGEAHIPGAVYAHLERDLSADLDGSNGRHPLPSVEALEERLTRLGIGNRTTVVAYDSRGGPFAARLWWTLLYLGHDRATVLDGGFPAWVQAGYPTEQGQSAATSARFKAEVRPGMVVSSADVLESLDEPSVQLIDARAPERYRGEQEPYDPVAGRIPGARNRFWQENIAKNLTFRPGAALRHGFEQILETGDPSAAISYCGSGVTAAHNALAMAVAGLPVPRVYAGSWSEWCSDSSRPTEVGP